MDRTAAIALLESYIESGRIMKREIEVDNHRVQLQSIPDILRLLDRLKSEETAAAPGPYINRRVVIGNAGDGLQ